MLFTYLLYWFVLHVTPFMYIINTSLFTVREMDYIEHNPSSTTAQSSFDDTAISIMQFPTTNVRGTGHASVLHTKE